MGRVHQMANGFKYDEKQEDLVEEVKRKIKEHVEEMYRYIEPTHQREQLASPLISSSEEMLTESTRLTLSTRLTQHGLNQDWKLRLEDSPSLLVVRHLKNGH